MNRGNFHLVCLAALLTMSVADLRAENFAPPAEGPIAFRRDQIPLDADTMASLSRIFVTLTQALDLGSAANRRTAAQMLALSTALDPGNSKARSMIADFQRSHPREEADASEEQLKSSQKRVWEALTWLETPEAGNQGHALAACLCDVIAISDPHHPKSEKLRAAGERGAWQKWIPPLAAYEPPVDVKVEPPTKQTPAETPFLLTKAQVSTVIWKADSKGDSAKWIQSLAPLQMVAEKSADQSDDDEYDTPKGFNLVIAPKLETYSFRGVSATITKLLKNQSSTLPRGLVTIHIPDLRDSQFPPKRQSISAAAAVLASAATTGVEPDACIIGVVNEMGDFDLPAGFWSHLQTLTSSKGGRLILPAAAAEYLPSMLAVERPQLFFNYEILLASNFQELLKLSAKTPDKSLEKSMTAFREIREKAGTLSLGQYVANPYVRKRLVEIMIENPNHLSAKMLAIQGAGNRPTYVSRAVLASELRSALQPMDWLVAKKHDELDFGELGKLGNTNDLCRIQVDGLARYAAKEDRALLETVQAMVTGIRTMDRAARSRKDDFDNYSAVFSAFSNLIRSYEAVDEELAQIIADATPAAKP